MVMPILPTECSRAREAASARLDGELTAAESISLDRHLRECPGCFAYATGVGSVAIALRGAALQQPAAPVFTPRERIETPRRFRVAALAAAAVLGAAMAASLVAGQLGGHRSVSFAPVTPTDATSVRADSADQHLLTMLQGVLQTRPGRMQAV